jgi:hypothetical protein
VQGAQPCTQRPARRRNEGLEGFPPSLGSFFNFEKGTKKKTGNCVSGAFPSVSVALTIYRYYGAYRS